MPNSSTATGRRRDTPPRSSVRRACVRPVAWNPPRPHQTLRPAHRGRRPDMAQRPATVDTAWVRHAADSARETGNPATNERSGQDALHAACLGQQCVGEHGQQSAGRERLHQRSGAPACGVQQQVPGRCGHRGDRHDRRPHQHHPAPGPSGRLQAAGRRHPLGQVRQHDAGEQRQAPRHPAAP